MTDGAAAARPRRVALLAGLLAFGGLATLLSVAVGGTGAYEGLPPWMLVLLAVPYLVLARAVWRARPWAWWALVVLQVADGAVQLLLATWSRDSAAASLDLLWPACYLALLASRRTQAWFGRGAPDP
ncbi:hypothetical protein OHA72_39995 [Dactylosporangium sp. NBC_01737]|uniref:hypothetical protein n=1 Tax=Dactylosporangium sp. NBC_01737 TaxID=2975959 RepID=UPI002E118A0E|nr:hypothetical protein OHA72_39995 [Dactylosporangium sp. NBC_01737]